MQKRRIILFIFCIFLISCNKEKRIREYFPDGKIQTEYIVINDKTEGKYTVYYPSGNIRYQVDCENNLRHGVETEYYENGNVKARGQCLFNKEYGRYYYYSEEQKLDSMIEYVWGIDPDLKNFPYFEHDALDKETAEKAIVVKNMQVRYDKYGEIIPDESRYCDVHFSKDNFRVGDSIMATLLITCPMKDLRTDTLFVFLMNDNEKGEMGDRYYRIENPIEHSFVGRVGKKSGINYLRVFIHYKFEDGTGRNLFVKEPFYVYE